MIIVPCIISLIIWGNTSLGRNSSGQTHGSNLLLIFYGSEYTYQVEFMVTESLRYGILTRNVSATISNQNIPYMRIFGYDSVMHKLDVVDGSGQIMSLSGTWDPPDGSRSYLEWKNSDSGRLKLRAYGNTMLLWGEEILWKQSLWMIVNTFPTAVALSAFLSAWLTTISIFILLKTVAKEDPRRCTQCGYRVDRCSGSKCPECGRKRKTNLSEDNIQ